MTKRSDNISNADSEFRDSFLRTLMQDVLLSMERQDLYDTQASRRDLIRTEFAAIEGCTWNYRASVRKALDFIVEISPAMELALSETSYNVSESGTLTEQTRFISLTAMIRFVTRLAEANCEGLKVDFTDIGWSSLKQAIAVRNRITHPKCLADLEISADDIKISQAGFFWLLNMIANVLESTNASASNFLSEFQTLVKELKSGDPTALAAYRIALVSLPD